MSNIFSKGPAFDFLYENATCGKDRVKLNALTEADMSQVNTNLVSKLYKSALNKSYIDFGDIPASKGDITKYVGYTDMVQCLSLVENIATRSNIKIHEVDVVNAAISNIVSMKDVFTKGYALNKTFIMLQYTALVTACVESTSAIIASFVDYTKSADAVKFTIVNQKDSAGLVHIDSLEKFNTSVSSGEYTKVINYILKNNNGVLTESVAAITAAIVGGIVVLVLLMREIVFRVYYNRMKLSEYLKLQAAFLMMNKANIEANSSDLSSKKKKEVIAKQLKLAAKLNALSDKLKVESSIANNSVNMEMKKESNTMTLDTLSRNDRLDSVELL